MRISDLTEKRTFLLSFLAKLIAHNGNTAAVSLNFSGKDVILTKKSNMKFLMKGTASLAFGIACNTIILTNLNLRGREGGRGCE